jgi:hypothetical protein
MEQGTSSNKELTVESVSNRKGKRSKQGKGKREKVTSDIELVSNRKGKRINPKPLKF